MSLNTPFHYVETLKAASIERVPEIWKPLSERGFTLIRVSFKGVPETWKPPLERGFTLTRRSFTGLEGRALRALIGAILGGGVGGGAGEEGGRTGVRLYVHGCCCLGKGRKTRRILETCNSKKCCEVLRSMCTFSVVYEKSCVACLPGGWT